MNDFYNLFQSTRFSIQGAGYAVVGNNWHTMVTDFRYVRIYYIREGEAELTLTTGRQVLKAGHLYFIPSFQILSGDCPGHLGHYFIHLIPDVFTDHFFSLLAFEKDLPLAPEIADYLFSNVVHHHCQDNTYSKIVTNNSIHLILSYFFRQTTDISPRQDLSKFVEVFDYIDKHIEEPIALSELANIMFMNKVYFSNIFKKNFGISPQQYIQQKKLDHARLLLADPTYSIAEVARALCFYDPAAFTTFFKKHTGMTPKQFRASLNGGVPDLR
ncbi:MAG: helix-turn-helix transcriptional regulator [Clostridia bacterium]|nr:helix-turn-helix transcriptional regulator [Clostridia bacterium]